MNNCLKIRDRREKGWFYLDNDYLNGYARIFGPIGTAIYVSLCRHSDNITQKCFPSLELIAKENGIGSTNTVRKYLKKFALAKIILIDKERDPKTKRFQNTVYTLLDKSEWVVQAQPVSMEPCATEAPSHAQPVSSKETHSKETHSISSPSSDKVIPEVILLFKEINPSYKDWYSRKAQREACQWLLDEFGFARAKEMVEFLPKLNSMPYAPTATSPYELKNKYARIKAFVDQEKAKKKIINKNTPNFVL